MALRVILVLALVAGSLAAQQRTVSSSTRPGVNDNASGALEGTRPEAVLRVVKAKGSVKSVDLAKRTVVFEFGKAEPLELAFSQPAGREQIKAGKKAVKRLGSQRLRLEDLEPGSKVRIQYYPLLGQLLDVVVD